MRQCNTEWLMANVFALHHIGASSQVHLLLFLVAMFHIVTAAVVLVIANVRMRSWAHWKRDDDQQARLCALRPDALRLGHVSAVQGTP
jgi:hypothetical protein